MCVTYADLLGLPVACPRAHATLCAEVCRTEAVWRSRCLTAIHEMKAAGRKIAHIAKVTGLSRPTIYRVIRQRKCAGKS